MSWKPMDARDRIPLRFRFPTRDGMTPTGVVADWNYGCYFPATDLCVTDMGQRTTGRPQGFVDWLDDDSVPIEWPERPVDTRILRRPPAYHERHQMDDKRTGVPMICTGIPARVEDRLDVAFVPESDRFEAPCRLCGSAVLIGPKIQALLDSGAGVLVCVRCLVTETGRADFEFRKPEVNP